jgi:tetratricopeptide (TPR) repeat protein
VKAAFEARSALRLAIDAGSKQGEATALESLGVASLATGNHEDAWEQFTAAQKIHEELDHPRGAALMTRHRGEAALAAGRIGQARELLTEALRYFATVAPEPYLHSRVLLSLARVHIAEDNLQGAELALNTVLDISSALGTLRDHSSALTALAEIADIQGSASLAKVRREAAAKLDTVLAEERRALTGVLGR